MLISDNRKEFYDIVARERSHVLVFVSHDLDSIAAAKIVRYIFECDHIRHTILPIRTRAELQRSYQEHRENIKFVLLINLGVTFDILDLFVPDPDVRIFVADSQRPFNVHNVYYDSNVYIMCAISGLNNIEDEFATIPKYEQLFWDDDIEDDDEEDVQNLSLAQLKRRNEFRAFEATRSKVLAEYEEYSRYSYSTALIFFDLAWKLGKDSNELLWMAILAVVDKADSFKLKEELTRREVEYLHSSMLRLRNIRSDRGFVVNSAAGVNNAGAAAAAGPGDVPGQADQPELITTTNHLSIAYEKDLALKLYREWSIYESLRHTLYVACKFKIWKQRGSKRLHTFLADLGIPLSQCRQRYQSMDLDLRRSLTAAIEAKMEKYGLGRIITSGGSFQASRALHQRYCAADLAAASRALLESPEKDKRLNQKFFDAYDSLSWSSGAALMEAGLELAKLQLISIVKQVSLIMDAHLMSLLNNVLLYVVIPEGTPDEALFCHPACLRTLSIYALHANAAVHSKAPRNFRLPLVFISPDPDRPGMGIVCGISPLLALKDCRTFFKQAFSNISRKLARTNPLWTYEESIVDPDIVYIPYSERMSFLTELSHLLETN